MKSIPLYIYVLLLFVGDVFSKYMFYDLGVWSRSEMFVPLLNTGVAWSIPIPHLFTVGLMLCMLVIGIYVWQKGYIYTYMGCASEYMLYLCDIALILLTAGALGNLYDRVVYEGVRDFVSINIGLLSDLGYPIFNIADIYIVVGVILLGYLMYRHEPT